MVRTIHDIDAAVARHDRVAAILERGKTDPFSALAALRKKNPRSPTGSATWSPPESASARTTSDAKTCASRVAINGRNK